MRRIDLNCDLGEGAGHDAEVMTHITSANIACGGHAGDERTMRETTALAQSHGVAIGAHPGFDDKANFGRRELRLAPGEIRALVERQVGALAGMAGLSHVKPHGALYNMAARDERIAGEIADAVAALDRSLVLVGLAGSVMLRAARERGLRVASEVFADRTYQPDGSLTPRSRPDAMIEEESVAMTQVLRMAREGLVRATDGREVSVVADTVCLHGDGAHPERFARALREALKADGISVVRL